MQLSGCSSSGCSSVDTVLSGCSMEWMQPGCRGLDAGEWMQLTGSSRVDAAWMQGAGCRRVDAAIKLEVAEWMQC